MKQTNKILQEFSEATQLIDCNEEIRAVLNASEEHSSRLKQNAELKGAMVLIKTKNPTLKQINNIAKKQVKIIEKHAKVPNIFWAMSTSKNNKVSTVYFY